MVEHNMSMTSFLERVSGGIQALMPRVQQVEGTTLGSLKDILLKEISNVTAEIIDLETD